MTGQPRRRFTLLDAIVLVAATAIGFAWICSNWYFEFFEWPGSWIDEAPDMLGPLLMTWTVAVVALRLLPPRPPLRRLVLRPGAAACVMVAFTFIMEASRYFVDGFARDKRILWGTFRERFVWVELMENAIVGGPYHYVVTAVWGLLFLSRRWRPEPTWIDRVGRLIALSWVLLAVWFHWNYLMIEWKN